MEDPKLNLAEKLIHFQKQLKTQLGERFSGLRCRGNCLKNAFINQRKFMKKRWWKKQRLQDSGRDFYENCINLF